MKEWKMRRYVFNYKGDGIKEYFTEYEKTRGNTIKTITLTKIVSNKGKYVCSEVRYAIFKDFEGIQMLEKSNRFKFKRHDRALKFAKSLRSNL